MDIERFLSNSQVWQLYSELLDNDDDDILIEDILAFDEKLSEGASIALENYMRYGKLSENDKEQLVLCYILAYYMFELDEGMEDLKED